MTPSKEIPVSGEREKRMIDALEAYELWEAHVILDDAAWRGDGVVISDALWDELMECQAKRNAALEVTHAGKQ